MRTVIVAIAVAAMGLGAGIGAVRSAHAQEYPWCAQYGGEESGGRNCGFVTYEQCMATVSGAGGFCERNLFFRAPAFASEPARPVARSHKKRPRVQQ